MNNNNQAPTFGVTLTGIRQGVDPNDARVRLAALFKTSPENIDSLLAQLPYVVKRGISEDIAAKYKAAILAVGGDCNVVPDRLTTQSVNVPTPNVIASTPIPSAIAEPPKDDDKLTACTACGHTLAKTADNCPKCGARNEWIDPRVKELAEFLRAEAVTRKEFTFNANRLTVWGSTEATIPFLRWNQSFFLAFVVGLVFLTLFRWIPMSDLLRIAMLIAAGIAFLVGGGFLVRVVVQSLSAKASIGVEQNSFKVDFSGTVPIWWSDDDQFWASVRAHVLGSNGAPDSGGSADTGQPSTVDSPSLAPISQRLKAAGQAFWRSSSTSKFKLALGAVVLAVGLAQMFGAAKQVMLRTTGLEVVSTLSPASPQVGAEYDELVNTAEHYLKTKGLADLPCDQIESVALMNVERGTVGFIADMVGAVDPPIPAIVAQINAICVIPKLRVTKPLDGWWMMIAYDKNYKMHRCIKIGGADLVKRFASKGCEFLPKSGENGLVEPRASIADASQATPSGSHSESAVPQFNSAGARLDLPIKEGMKYREARRVLLSKGWTPDVRAATKDNVTGDNPSGCFDAHRDVGDRYCEHFPEISNCAGTGEGACKMHFANQLGDRLTVIAREGPPEHDEKQNDNCNIAAWEVTANSPSTEVTPQAVTNTSPVVLRGAYICGKDRIIAYHDDGTYVESLYMVPNTGADPFLTGERTGRWKVNGTRLDKNQTGFVNVLFELSKTQALSHTSVQIGETITMNPDGSYSARRTQWVVDGQPQQITSTNTDTCKRASAIDQEQAKLRTMLPEKLFH